MAVYLASAPRRHLDFEIFYVVVHLDTVTDAPSPLEHSARHCIPLQPYLLVRCHGDLSPSALKFATKTVSFATFHMTVEIP